MANYSVYVLVNGAKPVYVGVTGSIKVRLSHHRKTKLFTSHEIIETFENKQDALIMERGIIKFISLFSHSMDNGLHSVFTIKSDMLNFKHN